MMMNPEDVLLVGVALLAVLFFIGGLINIFRAPVNARRRKLDGPGPAELMTEEWLEVESLRRCREAIPGDEPSAPQPLTPQDIPAAETFMRPEPVAASRFEPMPGLAATRAAPETAWPARPPAASTVLRQESSAFPPSDATGDPVKSSEDDHLPSDQAEPGKMVVHYADDRIIKGYCYDFHPNKPHFHLLPSAARFSFTDDAIEVWIEDLKAVFFVRDFAGDPSYNERKQFAEGERPPGRKVRVTFRDGEVLIGSTVGYEPRRPGFFFIPADPRSNNLKVFAVSRAVMKVHFL